MKFELGVLLATLLQMGTTSALEDQARAAMVDDLKDPFSAQFANLREVKMGTGIVLCGDVNGKNGYGAYVGFRPFVAIGDTALIAKADPSPAIEAATRKAVETACDGK